MSHGHVSLYLERRVDGSADLSIAGHARQYFNGSDVKARLQRARDARLGKCIR